MLNINKVKLNQILNNKKGGDFRRAITQLEDLEELLKTYPDKRHKILRLLNEDSRLIKQLFCNTLGNRGPSETAEALIQTKARLRKLLDIPPVFDGVEKLKEYLLALSDDIRFSQFGELEHTFVICCSIFTDYDFMITEVESTALDPNYTKLLEQSVVSLLDYFRRWLSQNDSLKNNRSEILTRLRELIKSVQAKNPEFPDTISELTGLVAEIETPKNPLSLKALGIKFFQEYTVDYESLPTDLQKEIDPHYSNKKGM